MMLQSVWRNSYSIMIRNTVLYNILWIATGTIVAIAIALMMNEIAKKPIAKLLQPVICFPSMKTVSGCGPREFENNTTGYIFNNPQIEIRSIRSESELYSG